MVPQPKRARREREGTPRLGPLPVRREIADMVVELQELVTRAGHHKPSQSLLLSALLYSAPRDGEELEAEYLVPYRKAFPAEE